jgi:uncharacterized protein
MLENRVQSRLITLDALRGFAVMGILAMNIVAFAMPEWAYISPALYADSPADRISWLFSFILFEGKMRGLFSLLFGASMMLIIERAEAKGEDAAKVHYARMFWLALFGLAHFFLLWFGDILFTYAAVGCIAFLLRDWEAEKLIKWALIVFGLGFLLWAGPMGGLQYLQYMANQTGAAADLLRDYQKAMSELISQADTAKQLAVHRGSWGDIIAYKLADPMEPLSLVMQSLPETLPYMMLGMAMQKNGFLAGEWSDADYRRWITRLLPAGFVITSGLGILCWVQNFELITMIATFQAWGMIPRLMLVIGFTAFLILLIRRLSGRDLLDRISAAGRAAFSNYLGTTIVMTSIFYGYGLGLFGTIGRPMLWLFVIGAWAIMLLWSKPWLERFHYGPLEWLWRSLARGQMQVMRK